MATTTGDLALYLPAIDEQGWGDEMNDNLEDIDQAITQRSSPVGTVAMTAKTTAPTGWLLCQGQAISRTTYSALFTAISTTWGVGDGSTTFNIPDLRGRAPIGVGTGSGLTARTIATNYGAETVTLTSNEMPSHSHSLTDPGHTHDLERLTSGATVVGQSMDVTLNFTYTSGADTVESARAKSNTTGITMATAGSGAAHANMQPSLAINFVIKY